MFHSSRFKFLVCPFFPKCSKTQETCPFSHIEDNAQSNQRIGNKNYYSKSSDEKYHSSLGNLGMHKSVEVKDACINTMLTTISSLKNKEAAAKTGTSPESKQEPKKRVTIHDLPYNTNQNQVQKKRKTNDQPTQHDQPPMILPSLHAKVSKEQRQKVLNKFFEEFKRIYSPILEDKPLLAHEHALSQEAKLHELSKKETYVSFSANILKRLRKRPISRGLEDIGIDCEYVSPYTPSDFTSKHLLDRLSEFKLPLNQLEELGYPVQSHADIEENLKSILETPRLCCRCNQTFVFSLNTVANLNTQNKLLDNEDMELCVFHIGNLYYRRNRENESVRIYSCCDEESGSKGCSTGPHVYKLEKNEELAKLINFKKLEIEDGVKRGKHGILALDCEMGYTTYGMEMIRLTVIDWDENVILDELCKAKGKVLDLNTQFSGVTSISEAKHTLEELQFKLKELMLPDTILLGHGLENDLKVLRIIHENIIDTSILFPHPNGLPFRTSLKRLMKDVLGNMVQSGSHDSSEDAKCCILLLKHKLGKTFNE